MIADNLNATNNVTHNALHTVICVIQLEPTCKIRNIVNSKQPLLWWYLLNVLLSLWCSFPFASGKTQTDCGTSSHDGCMWDIMVIQRKCSLPSGGNNRDHNQRHSNRRDDKQIIVKCRLIFCVTRGACESTRIKSSNPSQSTWHNKIHSRTIVQLNCYDP